MQPSSLIFVVIVGVWAAFFVQYWVRRREHMATARSVDAFSETMRVLTVRDALPPVDTAAPRRSYAVSPARAVRPQVTVKRAEALLAKPVDPPAAEPGGGALRNPAGGAAYAVRFAPTPATRGLTFLVGILGTVVYAVLSAFGVLVPAAPLVPLALAVGGFLWVRAGVRRRAVTTRRAQRVPLASSSRRPAPHRATPNRTAPNRTAPNRTEPARPAAAASAPRREEIYDVDRVAATIAPAEPAASVAPPVLDEDDLPLTWDPVPVPRPTYALKAPARRVPITPQSLSADADDDVPEVFPVARPSAARRSAAG